ncbi:MAG: hypothetical protein CMJ85_03440 [Planctomycetes bacterium]|nr:hypothetical protein [Planctomycetota bacterium]
MLRTRTLLSSLLPLLVLLGSCESTHQRDLARNPDLYRHTGYRASYRQNRRVYVSRLLDRRTPLSSHRDGIYPLTYTEDAFWARPVAEMLDELLRQEIDAAGLFAQIVDSEGEADWVLRPALTNFHGAVEERVVGRAVHGRAKIRLQVWGPAGAGGKRGLLRSEDYEGPIETEGRLFVPDPHALAAASFRKAVGWMLVDLDRGGRLCDGLALDPEGIMDSKRVDWR